MLSIVLRMQKAARFMNSRTRPKDAPTPGECMLGFRMNPVEIPDATG
jgi:hypothetical protein